jgi:hypothetical protein
LTKQARVWKGKGTHAAAVIDALKTLGGSGIASGRLNRGINLLRFLSAGLPLVRVSHYGQGVSPRP